MRSVQWTFLFIDNTAKLNAYILQNYVNEHKSELSGIRQEVLTSAKKKFTMSYYTLRRHGNKSSVAVCKV